MISLSDSCILLMVLLMVTKGISQNHIIEEKDTADLPSIFLPASHFSSGEQVWSVAVADMNKDQHPDVIAASKLDGKITVHLNDGQGQFSQQTSCVAQENNRAVCVLDANKDGFPDIGVVSLTGRLSILLNDKKGNLTVAQSLPAGIMAHDLIGIDVDGDQDMDLVSLSVSDRSLRFFSNNGKGHFQLTKTVKTGPSPRVIATGDLDGNGLKELVIGGDAGKLYIHWQRKRGQFQEFTSMRSTAASWGVALGDLDGNGSLDIAAASYHEKQLFIHLNKGDGTFEREQELLSGDHNFDLILVDIDLDGDLDVATCSTVDNALNLHLNDGYGIIGPRQEIRSGNWSAGLVAADVDKDGDQDIVLGSINDESIVLHRNTTSDQTRRMAKMPCLSGVVYNAADSSRIAQAQISIQDAKGRAIETAMTAKDGSFRFCLPPSNSYMIIVRSASFPVYRDSIDLVYTDVEKDIYLSIPTSSWVFGKVVNTFDHRPIPGAQFLLQSATGDTLASMTADSHAAFRHPLPFGRNYQLRAHAIGYDTVSRTFDLSMDHFPRGRKVIFRLTPNKEPLTACLSGIVRDKLSLDSLPGAQIEIRSLETGRFKRLIADRSGLYHICLPFARYELTTTHPGFFFQHTSVEVCKADATSGKKQDIFLKPLEIGASIVLKNIYFDVDRASLRDESMLELDRVLAVLKENPSMVVEIAGHTDSDATEEYNQLLSQNRSQSVVDYLMASGVAADRLHPIGYGENQPVAPNDSPENKQLNRRTEFLVKSFGYTGLEE
ncbi:MAG: FG-GAP-like repeat-containing protein [Bacteroidota bacterium]